MKILHKEINGCHECPHMVDMISGCPECSGGCDFAFCCSHTKDYKLIAGENERSLIKREWKEGKFNNIICFEIEIPKWCPLPDKE